MSLFGRMMGRRPGKPGREPSTRPRRTAPPDDGSRPPEVSPAPSASPVVAIDAHLLALLEDYRENVPDPRARELMDKLEHAVRSGGADLPAMPDEVQKLQAIAADPDCSTANLAHAIVTDPTLAAKFLAVANAPFYARGTRIRSVRDAVIRVGMDQAILIILAVVAHTKLFRAGRFQPEASATHSHSLATAVVSQVLARRSATDEQDAFMAGLLHDLGEIVVFQTAHELDGEHPGEDVGLPREVVVDLSERLHPGLSALTLQGWGFTPELVSAIQYHHAVGEPEDTDRASVPEIAEPLVHILSAADRIGWLLSGERTIDEDRLRSTLNRIGLELDPMIVDDARTTFETFRSHLGAA